MKTVRGICDLQDFGIIPLTGEADRLCFRILCDLTDQGARIVCEAFGLNRNSLAEPWNGGDHVASILLSDFQQVAIIALIGRYRHVLVLEGGDVIGIGAAGDGQEFLPAQWRWNEQAAEFEVAEKAALKINGRVFPWYEDDRGKIVRVFNGRLADNGCTRNEHMMSGRVY